MSTQTPEDIFAGPPDIDAITSAAELRGRIAEAEACAERLQTTYDKTVGDGNAECTRRIQLRELMRIEQARIAALRKEANDSNA